MNETFDDYFKRKGWSGHSERYVTIWNDWQRDRECLIASMEQSDQLCKELLDALHLVANHPNFISQGSAEETVRKIAREAIDNARRKLYE